MERVQSPKQSDFVCCDLCSKEKSLTVPVSTPTPYAGTTRTVSNTQKTTLK